MTGVQTCALPISTIFNRFLIDPELERGHLLILTALHPHWLDSKRLAEEEKAQVERLLTEVDNYHIVQDNQVRPPVSVLPATDFFTAADGLDLDVALGHQDVGPPHRTGQVPEVCPDRAVLLELHPDIVQKALGLVAAV